jgi:signal peptidase
MQVKGLLSYSLLLVIGVLLIGSLLGAFFDRPVFLSYAYSGSMSPTINKGDLFLINPLDRNPDVGDVAVFKANGRWTVHRIVAITERGYITKGDNNVATDQQNGLYPLVRKEDVIGKVVEIGSHPLVVRRGGTFIESVRSRLTNVYSAVVILIFGALLTFSGGGKRRRKRRRKFLKVHTGTLYTLVSVGIIAGFLFVTVSSWGTIAFTYSSTLAGGQREGWYLPGTSFKKNLSLENNAVYPFHYFIENGSDRFKILNGKSFDVSGRGSHTILLKVSVPEDTRIYREEVTVHSYPAILPGALVRALYKVNPYLPLLPYILELMGVLVALYYLADIGSGEVLRIRIRRRSLLSRIAGDG